MLSIPLLSLKVNCKSVVNKDSVFIMYNTHSNKPFPIRARIFPCSVHLPFLKHRLLHQRAKTIEKIRISQCWYAIVLEFCYLYTIGLMTIIIFLACSHMFAQTTKCKKLFLTEWIIHQTFYIIFLFFNFVVNSQMFNREIFVGKFFAAHKTFHYLFVCLFEYEKSTSIGEMSMFRIVDNC